MTTPAHSIMSLTKNTRNWAFYNGRGAGHPDTLQEGCEGIVKLIAAAGADAVDRALPAPSTSPRGRVQEKRTGIYDTHRKGR